MIKKIFLSLRPEIPAALILSSYLLFWLRAVDLNINSFTLSLFYAGLLINIPLALAFSPRGIRCLRNLISQPYGYPVILFYLVFTAFQCCAPVACQLHPSPPRPYLQVVLILMARVTWLPLCALILSFLLFRKKTDQEIDWKVILFLAIMVSLSKVDIWWLKLFSSEGIFTRFHELMLLKFKTERSTVYLELGEIWDMMVPIIFLLMMAVSHERINLKPGWDRRTLGIAGCFAAFIIFRDLIGLFIGKASLATSSWLWNLATEFYPQPVKWALLEEVLFRGVLQTYLSARLYSMRYGQFIAILLTALLFGIYHYPFIDTPWHRAAVMGILFGWAYYKSQNLWVPVSIHGLNNILIHGVFVFR